MLHCEERGSGRRLALVHGFTQSGRAWGTAADLLSLRYRLLALDAPGHGRSAAVRADLATGADLMAEAVSAGGPSAWLGYSMGGRYALHVALRHPEVVDRLILVSATGGIDDPDERRERARADDALAERIETEGLEAFLRYWLAQPLFAGLPPEAAQLEDRLQGDPAGLAASLRLAGTGSQEPLWDRLGGLPVPVLVIAGELDAKYVQLAGRLCEAIGANATMRIVAGAGHACHLERPERFADIVTGWL